MTCVDRSTVLLWSLAYLAVCALVLVGLPVYAAIRRRRRRSREPLVIYTCIYCLSSDHHGAACPTKRERAAGPTGGSDG